MQRDEKITADHRGRVVEGAVFIGDLERTQAKGYCQPACSRQGVIGLAADGAPGTVELLRASVAGQGLERMHAEPPFMRVEDVHAGRAADVRHPWTDADAARHLADHRVRHAQHHQVGRRIGLSPVRDAEVAFAKPCANGAAGPADADDVDVVGHEPPESSGGRALAR